MRRYLLDTTPLVALLSGRRSALERFAPWLEARELATSPLVYAEIVEYLRGSSNFDTRLRQLRDLLEFVHSFSLSNLVLERYSVVRRQLRPPVGPGLIGDIDTFIAATALEWDLTVVTSDSDFQRVPELKVLHIPRAEFTRV